MEVVDDTCRRRRPIHALSCAVTLRADASPPKPDLGIRTSQSQTRSDLSHPGGVDSRGTCLYARVRAALPHVAAAYHSRREVHYQSHRSLSSGLHCGAYCDNVRRQEARVADQSRLPLSEVTLIRGKLRAHLKEIGPWWRCNAERKM